MDTSIPIQLSSYRLGDLIYANLTYGEAMKLSRENPDSIGKDYIITPKKILVSCIDTVISLVNKHTQKYLHLFPHDISESTVIHLRLGDVMAGNEWHEIEKRPFSIDYLKSIVPLTNKIYVIGKMHFGDVSSTQCSTNYEESVNKSNKYLYDVLNEFNASHFDGGFADIDLCLAIKAKCFVQGKGYFSKLIVDIRTKLNLQCL